ncbi:MAG: hypothetical protein HY321_03525 [Armatimonadetes bacterium]|nr:hypothetical protein [Armatimonadota bacterium]
MRWRVGLLLVCLVLPGAVVAVWSLLMFWRDWPLLQDAMAAYTLRVREGADLRALFVAEASQDVHRINVFCEGVWGLLGAILAGIGLHGIALLRRDGPLPKGVQGDGEGVG